MLPYAIRPLVYETSFEEFISVEEYVPTRAFLQAYGFLPYNNVKLDYALYLGNSPNINDLNERGQTGVDTTASFLVGGRVGIRLMGLKAGVSATRQNIVFFAFAAEIYGGPIGLYEDISQTRFGADLSMDLGRFFVEGEYIALSWEEVNATDKLEKHFYYGTLGYDVTERALIYGTFWHNGESFEFQKGTINVYSAGLSYSLNDRTKLKAQYARAEITNETFVQLGTTMPRVSVVDLDYLTVALSVFF